MKSIKFEKVSLEQFKKDLKDINLLDCYNNIILPKRATSCSAGYDFFLPYDIEIKPKSSILIPSGIRVSMNDSVVLMIYPRSSLGFKYNITLANTVGIIDADYYNALNEGHIMIKLVNNSDDLFKLEKGKAFVQGIFVNYLLTDDDNTTTKRTGGIGSTTK